MKASKYANSVMCVPFFSDNFLIQYWEERFDRHIIFSYIRWDRLISQKHKKEIWSICHVNHARWYRLIWNNSWRSKLSQMPKRIAQGKRQSLYSCLLKKNEGPFVKFITYNQHSLYISNLTVEKYSHTVWKDILTCYKTCSLTICFVKSSSIQNYHNFD